MISLTPAKLAEEYDHAWRGYISVEFPMQTLNPLNRREHWAARSRRAKLERHVAYMYLKACGRLPTLPAEITLTRLGPRTLDSDAIPASMKAVRDAIQDCYGVDDGSPLFAWLYAQERAKQYGVRVEIQSQEPAR